MANWGDVLKEINGHVAQHSYEAQVAVDTVRHKYLDQLFRERRRNIIAYYSGFLSKPNIAQTDINDEDKNGFMMAIHGLETKNGLDLILHTPGGGIAATESIINYLHQKFGNDIVCIVPQIAMSAGTIMACSCKQILMTRHSNLGPIDPQLAGIPTYGLVEEVKRAIEEIRNDPGTAVFWRPVFAQISPTFLSQCENAIAWSKEFAGKQLVNVMFKGEKDRTSKSNKIVKALTDFRGNKSHGRHIHFEECRSMGLKVELIEDNPKLQDIVVTLHHCYMHSLMNTHSFKIIENHKGAAFVKQQAVQTQMLPVKMG